MARHHTKRTDPHCPRNIKPEDYSYVGTIYLWSTGRDGLGEALANAEARRAVEEYRKAHKAKWSKHEHAGTCGVCGATARYVGIWHHRPTNTLIRAGEECSMNMDAGSDFAHLRKAVKDAREYNTGKARAEALCKDHDVEAAWTWWVALRDSVAKRHEPDMVAATRKELDGLKALEWGPQEVYNCPDCSTTVDGDEYGRWNYTPKGECLKCNEGWLPSPRKTGRRVVVGHTYELETILDLIWKLVRYGDLSEKQWAFLASLQDRVYRRAEIEKQWAEEDAKAEDCPSGRVELEGMVLKTRMVEGHYGTTLKMLLKDDRGFRVWGTVPAALAIVEQEVEIPHWDFDRWLADYEYANDYPMRKAYLEALARPAMYDANCQHWQTTNWTERMALLAKHCPKLHHRLEWAYDDYTDTPATRKLQRGLQKGDRVAFTAKVEPKEGERTFGTYSRPTKARVVELAPAKE